MLLLITFTLAVSAKENITIIYGFSAADNSANYARTLADEANKIQDKYNFIFDVKSGGGQAVAVNYIKNTPNTIFMTSGAFWLRPNLYPHESWDVHDFRTLWTQCSAPFAVASVKYKSWKEVPTDRPMSIATSGLGVISHLVALDIQKKFPQLTIIPFKSTTDALISTAGGQVDFAVVFLGDIGTWANENNKIKLTILGTTGPKYIGNYPNLSSQGFSPNLAKMNTPYNLMIPSAFNQEKAKEIRDILVKVENAKSIQNSYAPDYCQPYHISEDKLDSWFEEQNKYWTKMSIGVKVE